ncbi:MAG: hypothetical protein Kow0042_11630 [Calditrichia bacterium]
MKPRRIPLRVKCLGLLLWINLAAALMAQPIFPGFYGEVLLDSLVAHYKPAFTLGYSQARIFMFTDLDNHNDSVTCVYTGYRIFLDHTSSDPIQQALAAGINTEHTWPQSLGATGQAKSDLHHLFPTRDFVNADRGNDPFSEIPDAETDRWYRLNLYQSSIPTAYIEEYSEKDFDLSRFEPREDHKGNVARAMFYFYTMYKDQANAQDPTYFPLQKETLRAWNTLDPVDSLEIQRTLRIAAQQDGKPNPFILDTTLIGRAYFPLTSLPQPFENKPIARSVFIRGNYPNPFNSQTTLSFWLTHAGEGELSCYNLQGKVVWKRILNGLSMGENEWVLTVGEWPSGFYFVRLKFRNETAVHKVLLIR